MTRGGQETIPQQRPECSEGRGGDGGIGLSRGAAGKGPKAGASWNPETDSRAQDGGSLGEEHGTEEHGVHHAGEPTSPEAGREAAGGLETGSAAVSCRLSLPAHLPVPIRRAAHEASAARAP